MSEKLEEKKCYVCNGTKPSILTYRCEKHDVCLVCGINRKNLDETPWAKDGGFICQQCRRNRIAENIKQFQEKNADEDEFWDDEYIICPWCGYKHEPDGESSEFYEDGDSTFNCNDCEKSFKVDTYVSFSYTTRKK